MNKVSIKVLQPNGLELIYTADEVQWNNVTKTITIKTPKGRKTIPLAPGMKAYVMNERGSTISIYKA
jgi:hypothetical protein